MTNRAEVWKCFQGVTIEARNFAFEVQVILGLENTCPGGSWTKKGLNGPMTNRTMVWKYFQSLTIETNSFAFDVKFIPRLASTRLDDY